jgi:Short C-terminal domain
MMRRRPLARAAVVGGVAYHAGKKGQQSRDAEAEQNAQIAELQAQQQYAPPPQAAAPAAAAPTVGSTDMVQQLENLKSLLDQGILTQAEFDMQKQKLLSAS